MVTKFQVLSVQKTQNAEKVTNLKTPARDVSEVMDLRALTRHAGNPRASKVSMRGAERSPDWMVWLANRAYHCLGHRSWLGRAVGGVDFAWHGNYIRFPSHPPQCERLCCEIKLSVVMPPVPLMPMRESEWDYDNSAATKPQLDI